MSDTNWFWFSAAATIAVVFLAYAAAYIIVSLSV